MGQSDHTRNPSASGAGSQANPSSGNVLTSTDGLAFVRTGWDFPAKVLDVCDAPDGGGFSLAVLDDGTVWARGNNQHGQLGDGTVLSRSTWGRVGDITNGIAVAAGRNSSYALLEDGTVASWGGNTVGELGDGSCEKRRVRPAPVTGLRRVVQMVAGSRSAYARLESGGVMAWGLNYSGQLGDGSRIDSPVPIPVIGLTMAVSQIAAGSDSAYALAAGKVFAWGSGLFGALGAGLPAVIMYGANDDGKYTFRERWTDLLEPKLIPFVSDDIVEIAAGAHSGCALAGAGHVWAWGAHEMFWSYDKGRGGLWTAKDGCTRAAKMVRGLTEVLHLSARGDQMWAMHLDGEVSSLTAGSGGWGVQTAHRASPTPESRAGTLRAPYLIVPDFTPASPSIRVLTDRISALNTVTVSALIDTRMLPSAQSTPVMFTISDSEDKRQDRPRTARTSSSGRASVVFDLSREWRPPGERFVIDVKCGDAEGSGSVVVLSTNLMEIGTLVYPNELDVGPTDSAFPAPVVSVVSSGSGSGRFDVALLSDGSVWARGSNAEGQLGDGTTISRATWAPVGGLSSRCVQIATTLYTAYAIRDDRTLWFWGRSPHLQGVHDVGRHDRSCSPRMVSVFRDKVRKISCGAETCFVVSRDTEFGGESLVLWGWGRNDRGQVGCGSDEAVVWPPVQVYLATDPAGRLQGSGPFLWSGYKDVVAGEFNTYATTVAGQFFAWGANDLDQIGDESGLDRRVPLEVKGMSHISHVTVSGSTVWAHGFQKETIYGWGDNSHGQFIDSPGAPGTHPQPRLWLIGDDLASFIGSIVNFVFAKPRSKPENADRMIYWKGRSTKVDASDAATRSVLFRDESITLPRGYKVEGFGTTSGTADGTFVFFSRSRS